MMIQSIQSFALKTKRILLNSLSTLSVLIFVSACGSATTDPLAIIDNPVPNLQLDSIVFGVTPTLNTPFSSANPFWTFASWGSVIFVSPANGMVSERGVDYVKIFHSGRLATKISGLGIINVRDGDYVVSGQSVGTFSTVPIQFQVLLDGTPVCPLSFMSQAFRQFFFSGVNINPCRS